MTTAIAKVDETSVLASYSREQIDLIKSQVALNATDDELKLFLYTATKRGLDPLAKQIYCIRRKQWDSESRQEVWRMTIQTSIDGFRSIAERTGSYAPDEEKWVDGPDGLPVSATVSMRKRVGDKWLKFSATAHWAEYAQAFEDRKTGTKKLGAMWAKMPHVMLAKCAEAKALRKGWPEQLGGLYVNEEMDQADAQQADRFAALAQEPKLDVKQFVAKQQAQTSHPEPALIEAPKKKTLPPIPDKLEFLPTEILQVIAPLRPLIGTSFEKMTLDELDLVKSQAMAFAPRGKTPEWKAWMTALQAESTHRIGNLEASK